MLLVKVTAEIICPGSLTRKTEIVEVETKYIEINNRTMESEDISIVKMRTSIGRMIESIVGKIKDEF